MLFLSLSDCSGICASKPFSRNMETTTIKTIIRTISGVTFICGPGWTTACRGERHKDLLLFSTRVSERVRHLPFRGSSGAHCFRSRDLHLFALAMHHGLSEAHPIFTQKE